MSVIKLAIKAALRRAGLDLRKAHPDPHGYLRGMSFSTIIDVGANRGQFARFARVTFPTVPIIAFEPLPDCADAIRRTFRSDPDLRVVEAAVGDSSGKITIHRNQFSPSSSLLPMSRRHVSAFPHTARTTDVEVPIDTLDNLLASVNIGARVMLKIDVQGFEDRVLRGASATVAKCSLIIVETSFIELYEGQPLFADVHGQLMSAGFHFSGAFDQIVDPANGEILQIDAIFRRHEV
jgi:FkbM family methyltransferase